MLSVSLSTFSGTVRGGKLSAGRWLAAWTQHEEQPRLRFTLLEELDDESWARLMDGATSYYGLMRRPVFQAMQRTWARLRSTRDFYG